MQVDRLLASQYNRPVTAQQTMISPFKTKGSFCHFSGCLCLLSLFGIQHLDTIVVEPRWQWAKKMGSRFDSSPCYDGKGSLYFLGNVEAGGTVGSEIQSKAGAFLVKISSSGEIVWIKNAGGQLSGSAVLATDPEGNLIMNVANRNPVTFPGIATCSGSFVGKITPNGEWLWIRQYTNGQGTDYRTEAPRHPKVVADSKGNIIFSTSFKSLVLGGSAISARGDCDYCRDVVLAKYSKEGDLLWMKIAGSAADDGNFGLAADEEDSIYMLAHLAWRGTFGPFTPQFLFATKCLPDGRVSWLKEFPINEETFAMALLPNGKLALTAGELKILDRSTGEVVNRQALPSALTVKEMALENQKSIRLLGWLSSQSSFAFGSSVASNSVSSPDIFVAEIGLDLKPHWIKTITPASGDSPFGMCLDSFGSTYVTGSIQEGSFDSIYFSGNGQNQDFFARLALPSPAGASGTAQIDDGRVKGVTVDFGGSGYTTAPLVKFVGGGGEGATGSAILKDGVVTSILINNPGTGYTQAPTVVLDLPPLANRRALAQVQVLDGKLMGVTIVDGGFGYTEPPKVVVRGVGTGAALTALVANGSVKSISIVNAGVGFQSDTSLLISSPPFWPVLEIFTTQVGLRMKLVLEKRYLLESSADLKTWNPVGESFVAKDELYERTFDVTEGQRHFRIQEVP